MSSERAVAIERHLRTTFPSGDLPTGALRKTAVVFGVSGERVRQIAARAGMRTVRRVGTPRVLHGCEICGKPVSRATARYCADCREVTLACATCRKPFLRSRRTVRARPEAAAVYCSRACLGRMVGRTFGFGRDRASA